MAQRQSVPPLNANIQQSLNQTADAIDGLNRHGRDVQAINFVRPFPRGFTTGHCLMNNLPYSKADRRATIAAWAITAASFMSAVTYRQWQGGYWFTGRRPDN